MSETRPRLLNAILQIPPALAVIPLLLLLWASFQARVVYPFDVEWMEGGMLLHGHRVQTGEGLYVIPSSEFIPFIYPPLYSWLLGCLSS